MYFTDSARPYLPLLALYIAGLTLWEWLNYRRRAQAYPWHEILLTFGVGLVRRIVLQVGGVAVTLFALHWFYRFHWLTLPVSLQSWREVANGLLLFLGVEFFIYWEHRLAHQVRWFWADHSVHHSSNRLVLLVAGRLGWFEPFTGVMMVFAPMCLLGFSPEAVMAMVTLTTLYQYWLHTEVIGKLGRFEYLFNTPSHHRVHHGVNPRYLDSNYGSTLIVFDRMFGTFVEEDAAEPVRLGLVQPQLSMNPLVVGLQEWRAMLGDALRHWRHPARACRYLFGAPGWSHDGSRQTTAMMRRNSAERPAVVAQSAL